MSGRPYSGYLHKRGSIWWLTLSWQGRRFQTSLHTTDRREAEKNRDDFVRPLRLNDKVSAIKALISLMDKTKLDALQPSRIPVKDIWTHFTPTHGSSGRVTSQHLQQKQSHLESFCDWTKASFMDEVDASMAMEYRTWLQKKDSLTATTINKHIMGLHSIWALSPFPSPWKLKPLKIRCESRDALTLDEIRTVIAKADGELRLLLIVGAYTGMRLGDCVSLRYDQVKDGRLERRANKTDKTISLPIAQPLAEALAAHPRTSDLVFPKLYADWKKNVSNMCRRIGEHFRSCGIDTTVKAEGRRAISKKGFHALRHSFCTLMASAGVPMTDIRDWVGHSSVMMTGIYTHSTHEGQQKILNALSTATCT